MTEDALRVGLSLIALSMPFVVALLVALRPDAKPQDTSPQEYFDDYFLFRRELSPHLFLKTSVGYSLQVASIYLFLLWTFRYGASSLFIPVAWALGYLAMYLALRKGWLNEFLGVNSPDALTIHGFVGQGVHQSMARRRRWLIRVLAFATIVGVGGTLITEIDYTTRFVLAGLGISTDAAAGGYPYADELLHVTILLFTGFYVLWGGYRAVVLTDTTQVPLSYASFGIVLFSVCGLAVGTENSTAAGLTALLAAVLLLSFLSARKRIVRHVTTQDRLLLWGLSILGFVVGIAALVDSPTPGITWDFVWPQHEFFWGFGAVGLVALFVANVIWQFVDISSLQRLKSVGFKSGDSESIQKLGKGLLAAAFEAAGVWVLVILLAFAFKAVGVETYEAIPTFLAGLGGFALLLLPTLIFAYTVFMMSTVDGFMSAVSFVAFYDLRPATIREDRDQESIRGQLRGPQWTTVATVFLIYAGYLILKWRVEKSTPAEESLALILYAIYALQLSIFPVVIARMIWPRRVSAMAGMASVGVGAYCALYTAAIRTKPWSWVPPDSWYVFPPLATFIGAGVTYITVATVAGKLGRRSSF